MKPKDFITANWKTMGGIAIALVLAYNQIRLNVDKLEAQEIVNSALNKKNEEQDIEIINIKNRMTNLENTSKEIKADTEYIRNTMETVMKEHVEIFTRMNYE